MRDAQSMLDQLVAFCGEDIKEPDVLEIFGFTALETIAGLGEALLNRETVAALEKIYAQSESGKDLSKLLVDLIGHLRSVLVYQVDPDGAAKDLAPEILDRVKSQAANVDTERLLSVIDHFATIDGRMKWAPNKRLHLEVGIIKAIQILASTRLSDVIDAIDGTLATTPGQAALSTASSPPATDNQSSATPAPLPSSEASLKSKPQEKTQDPPPPTSAGKDLSGEEVWAAILEHLSNNKPIAAEYAQKAVFTEEDEEHFTVAIAPEETIAKESLMRDRTRNPIEQLLESMRNAPRKLKIELRDDVKPDTPPIEMAEEEEPVASPDEATPQQEQSTEEDQKQSPSATDDMYNDPLIKDALEIFEADIKKN